MANEVRCACSRTTRRRACAFSMSHAGEPEPTVRNRGRRPPAGRLRHHRNLDHGHHELAHRNPSDGLLRPPPCPDRQSGWSTPQRGKTCPPGKKVRSECGVPTSCSATTTGRTTPPKPSPTAGTTPATSDVSIPTATSPSAAESKNSSSAAARISTQPKSRPSSSRTNPSKTPPSKENRTKPSRSPRRLRCARGPGTLRPRRARASCHEHLADFKVPHIVHTVTAIPRTGSGKIIRGKLAAQP